MLSNFGKRRSTRKSSLVSAATAPSVNSSPSSPQFGGEGGIGGGDDVERPSKSSSSGGASQFDDRVRSVRSRIKEMVATAEDSSDASEALDVKPRGTTAAESMLRRRGSQTRRKSSASEASSVAGDTATDEPAKAAPQRVNSFVKPASKGPRSLNDVLPLGLSSSAASNAGSDTTPSVARPQGPAARASAAAAEERRRSASSAPTTPRASAAAAEERRRSASPAPTGQQVVGRDGAAYMGARVRVLDPKVARYVEATQAATGTICEVRCSGERVRVEHDGSEKAHRYYSTGKNGEYQLAFESPAGAEPSSTLTPRRVSADPSSSLTPRRVSRRLPEAPPIIADSSSSSSEAPEEPPPRRAKVAPARRSKSEPPIIAEDTQPDIAEPKVAMKKPTRYSQVRQARQSDSASVASSVADGDAASEAGSQPGGRISYSQRRSMLISQARASASGGSDPVAAVAAKAAEPVAARAAPKENRHSATAATKEPIAARATTTQSVASSSSSQASKVDLEEKKVADVHEQETPFQKLHKEHEELICRLRNLEQTFVRDLGAVKDDVVVQIEMTEKRIATRVLEEVDKRIRQVSGLMSTKAGKLSMDMGYSNDMGLQNVGTPLNEEPEQEYDTCDLILGRGSRKGSEVWKTPPVEETTQVSAEVSQAELADNRLRLQNIGNAARRITSSLGGNTAPPVNHSPMPALDYDGLHNSGLSTPDFASAPSFSGSPLQMAAPASKVGDSPSDLDAEMERLAGLRRFAASVMQAAEASSNSGAASSSSWGDAPHGGMRGSVFSAEGHQGGPRNAANQPDHQDPPFQAPSRRPDSGSMGRQRSAPAVPRQRAYEEMPPTPWEMPRPPQQASASSQRWSSGAQNSNQPRRSSAQPMHVPWPAQAQGSNVTEGRLVF